MAKFKNSRCRCVVKFIFLGALSVFCSLGSFAQSQIDAEEYEVYKAWLEEAFIKPNLTELVVLDKTIDYWNDLTEIPLRKKREIAELQIETLDNYRARNKNPRQLKNNLGIRIPVYFITKDDLMTLRTLGSEEHSKSPAKFRIAFSGVGFNRKKTQALIHVHYKDNSDSKYTFGFYFLLSRDTGTWMVKQRTMAWQY